MWYTHSALANCNAGGSDLLANPSLGGGTCRNTSRKQNPVTRRIGYGLKESRRSLAQDLVPPFSYSRHAAWSTSLAAFRGTSEDSMASHPLLLY
ncbi:hypothetical protein PHYPO_G00091040 [Pangasianodon hypophthalmus]|uniref:Uncharacterized protein n=1 Tax=Pangasianodon hypophthalmus TaxID=310915 RepID=A0A5N5LAM6_PANHP|nr:hypothetical protein PHYPO_G00091040 [Pangasianodon hypophthalmus]